MAYIHLQFVLGRDISSRLIAWYGQGYGGYSHVDSVLSDGTLAGARSDSVGGHPPGFQIRPPGYANWSRRCVVQLRVTKVQAVDWEKWLRNQVGTQYDRAAIWGFLLGRRRHSTGMWICSAAAREALEHIDMLYGSPLPDYQVTPNSLLLLCTDGIGGRIVN